MSLNDFYDGEQENDPINESPTKQDSGKTPVLDNFSSDITKMVKDGKVDPVIGRDEEVKRLVRILTRKKKNNALIVGEAGVGKTALIEKLATLILSPNPPIELINKRVVSLDLTLLISGTKFRGQFEERMKHILKELKNNKNVILFIDEVHTIMGAGNPSGSMDLANLLKPALGRGEIQCIGATTFNEYKKSLEKDEAIERRFQKIMLDEPSVSETIEILTRIKGEYEKFHGVSYSDEIIESVVKLSDQYITNRFFPDKALDVMDDIGTLKKSLVVEPENISQLKEKISQVIISKNEVVIEQNYEQAKKLKSEQDKLEYELDEVIKTWKSNKLEVTIDDVYSVLTEVTGVPITRLDEKNKSKLNHFQEEIKKSVIGQDEAVDIISKTIKRNMLGIGDKNKPIGSYMFLGETGVGKTHLVKTISKELFGSEKNVIRLDMSEYMEKHNVSKLIGSPPGFVGYEEGGQLTEKVKNNPFSIILFDEIEKAHKDIFNIMLQILDEGRLTDSFGKTVNFKNTVIIMTSNTGTKKANEFGGGVGFNSDEKTEENKRSIIESEVKKHFAPEFLNRFDDIIYFNRLDTDNLKHILDVEITKVVNRISERNFFVKVDETVKDEILSKNKDLSYGARPLKRLIQKYVEDYLSDQILNGEIQENAKVILKFNEKMYHENDF